MKLKLSRQEFSSLYAVFQTFVMNFSPLTMEEKLLAELLNSIYAKMYVKAVHVKQKYVITLSAAECIGFWLYFQRHPLPAGYVFETNLIDTVSNSIHKQAY